MWQSAVSGTSTALCLAIFVAGSIVPSLSRATSCRLTNAGPSSIRLTWVDNSGFDDGFLSFSPGLQYGCTGGGRIQTDINYRASLDMQLSGGADAKLTQYLDASARARLYEYNFYVNATARAGLASLSGRDLVGSDGVSRVTNNDLVQTYSASVTPELRNRFGSFANSVLTTTFNVVDSTGNAGFASTGTGLNWTLSSGSQFPIMPWSINMQTNRVAYDGPNETRDNITAQVSRRFDQRWLLSGSIGYENNDVQTTRDNTDGVTWSVGANWTPTSSTSFDASYGERYFGNTWNVQASHVGSRTRLSASFVRDITNVRNLLLEPGRQFILVDPATGLPVVDPVTGEPLVFQEFLPELTTEDYLQDTANISVGVNANRTNGTMQFAWSKRSYEDSDLEQREYNVRLNLSRQLQSDLSGGATFWWQKVNSSSDFDTKTYFVSLSANQRIGRRSNLGLEASHRNQRNSGASNDKENRISIVFSTQFF